MLVFVCSKPRPSARARRGALALFAVGLLALVAGCGPRHRPESAARVRLSRLERAQAGSGVERLVGGIVVAVSQGSPALGSLGWVPRRECAPDGGCTERAERVNAQLAPFDLRTSAGTLRVDGRVIAVDLVSASARPEAASPLGLVPLSVAVAPGPPPTDAVERMVRAGDRLTVLGAVSVREGVSGFHGDVELAFASPPELLRAARVRLGADPQSTLPGLGVWRTAAFAVLVLGILVYMRRRSVRA